MTVSDHDPRHCRPASLARMPWRRFVVLGDSSPDWAARVTEALRSVRPDLAHLDLGRYELSTAQVRTGQLARALAFRGDLAAVVVGGREAARASFDIDAVEAELSRIVGPLRCSGADVLILGPCAPGPSAAPPEEPGSGPRRRLRILAERTRDLALRHGALYVETPARPAGCGGSSVADAVVHRLADHLDATRDAR
ncbi:hypothetical protein [Streptomyces sp. WG-D5]